MWSAPSCGSIHFDQRPRSVRTLANPRRSRSSSHDSNHSATVLPLGGSAAAGAVVLVTPLRWASSERTLVDCAAGASCGSKQRSLMSSLSVFPVSGSTVSASQASSQELMLYSTSTSLERTAITIAHRRARNARS